MKTVLALAAHPDDVEIGCGGTLASYVAEGMDVHLYVATGGEKGGDVAIRRREQDAAAGILGIRQVHWGGYEDTRLPSELNSLIASIESLLAKLNPSIVFVNHGDDTHQDHRTLAQAAQSATRYVPNVLAYETPTSNRFDPSVFRDISQSMRAKCKALEAHVSQIEHTNIQGLNIIEIARSTAHYRGIQGRINSAEAFVPIRMQL